MTKPGTSTRCARARGACWCARARRKGRWTCAGCGRQRAAAVIIEIMRDDGEMARLPDLVELAARHGIKIRSVAQIVSHRLAAGESGAEDGAEGGHTDSHVLRRVQPDRVPIRGGSAAACMLCVGASAIWMSTAGPDRLIGRRWCGCSDGTCWETYSWTWIRPRMARRVGRCTTPCGWSVAKGAA